MARTKGRETPSALQAFEDYWAMGDDRSLPKLAVMYREKRGRGEQAPTKRLSQLAEWSTTHHWQDRCKSRIEEEAEIARRKHRARVDRQRERIMLGIEVGSAKFLQAIERGEVVLVEDIGDLATGTRLYFQVAGEPLAEKTVQEHTGPNGGPIPFTIVQFGEDDNGGGNRAPSTEGD